MSSPAIMNEHKPPSENTPTEETEEKTKRATKTKSKATIEKNSKISKESILSRINEFRILLNTLESCLTACCHNLSDYEQAVVDSETILQDLTHNDKLISSLISERETQLKEAEERYRILTADDLTGCSHQHLEDASDILWAGLQAATLALSRRPEPDSVTSTTAEIDLDIESFICEIKSLPGESVPEATFLPISSPTPYVIKENAADVCKRMQKALDWSIVCIGDVFCNQYLKEAESTNLKTYSGLNKKLGTYQKKIKSINDQYGQKREKLLSLEFNLETRLRQVNRLSGKDSYESLSTPQLRGLCKIINKASRRLATEQAIREVYSQQKQSTEVTSPLSVDKDPNLCLICFERPWDCHIEPCEHKLCQQCGKRLKYCPKCRIVIQKLVELEAS